MKILYCASEANPFAGSGGLADVAGSLPHTICRKGHDCRIVMPLYGTIPYELTCAVSKRVPRVYFRDGKEVERELLLRF